MTGIDVLRMQLEGSFNLIHDRLEQVTDSEWNSRALDGTSKLGFILWHAGRIIDWTVQNAIQGKPEVADGPAWRDTFPAGALYGAGISDSLADTIPESVTREGMLRYMAEVRASVMDWFGRQTPETLDIAPPLRKHQELTPGYLDPDVWAAVADLDGLKAWTLLARPCISHIRVHVGEYGVLLNALRARSRASA
jgi:hypothetical protein